MLIKSSMGIENAVARINKRQRLQLHPAALNEDQVTAVKQSRDESEQIAGEVS
jgi:hypothetical protein